MGSNKSSNNKVKTTEVAPAMSLNLNSVATMVLTNKTVIDTASNFASKVITKLASKISLRYPPLATFVREGMVSLEAKIHEFNMENGSGSATNTDVIAGKKKASRDFAQVQ